MSYGRKYALEFVNQSADEIIAEVQRKYSIIVERMQAYDSLIKNHEDLKKTFLCVASKVEKLPNAIEDLNNMVSATTSSLKDEINSVLPKIATIEKKISYVSIEKEEEKESVIKKFSLLAKSINEINAHLSKSSEFQQELDNRVRLKNVGFSNEIKSLKEDLDKYSDEVSDIKEAFSSTKESVKKMLADFSSRFSFLTELEPKFKEFKKDIESKALDIHYVFKDEMKKFYQHVEDQNKAHADMMTSLKTECKKLINDNFLDIKNSQIKFENINKQISLMEKKIENFNLLLKKYELDK